MPVRIALVAAALVTILVGCKQYETAESKSKSSVSVPATLSTTPDKPVTAKKPTTPEMKKAVDKTKKAYDKK